MVKIGFEKMKHSQTICIVWRLAILRLTLFSKGVHALNEILIAYYPPFQVENHQFKIIFIEFNLQMVKLGMKKMCNHE